MGDFNKPVYEEVIPTEFAKHNIEAVVCKVGFGKKKNICPFRFFPFLFLVPQPFPFSLSENHVVSQLVS